MTVAKGHHLRLRAARRRHRLGQGRQLLRGPLPRLRPHLRGPIRWLRRRRRDPRGLPGGGAGRPRGEDGQAADAVARLPRDAGKAPERRRGAWPRHAKPPSELVKDKGSDPREGPSPHSGWKPGAGRAEVVKAVWAKGPSSRLPLEPRHHQRHHRLRSPDEELDEGLDAIEAGLERWRTVMSQQPSKAPILVNTTERPAGYEVNQALGHVFGVVVRSRGLGGNIMASLRALGGGGEIVENTPGWWRTPRRHAGERMIENAQVMGANAVVMMRFDSSEIGQTMTEIVAYGTAAIVGRQRLTYRLWLAGAIVVFAVIGYFVTGTAATRARRTVCSGRPTRSSGDPTTGKMTRGCTRTPRRGRPVPKRIGGVPLHISWGGQGGAVRKPPRLPRPPPCRLPVSGSRRDARPSPGSGERIRGLGCR